MYFHQVREGTSGIRELIQTVKNLKAEVNDLRSTLAASKPVSRIEVITYMESQLLGSTLKMVVFLRSALRPPRQSKQPSMPPRAQL